MSSTERDMSVVSISTYNVEATAKMANMRRNSEMRERVALAALTGLSQNSLATDSEIAARAWAIADAMLVEMQPKW